MDEIPLREELADHLADAPLEDTGAMLYGIALGLLYVGDAIREAGGQR